MKCLKALRKLPTNRTKIKFYKTFMSLHLTPYKRNDEKSKHTFLRKLRERMLIQNSLVIKLHWFKNSVCYK